MYCKKCGYQSNLESRTCLRCGALLDDGGTKDSSSFYEAPELLEKKPEAEEIHKTEESIRPPKQKSRLVAAFLQMFLGGFGAGRFYLGYTGIGTLQFLTLFVFGIGYIWGFIDGVLILLGQLDVDAEGNVLK